MAEPMLRRLEPEFDVVAAPKPPTGFQRFRARCQYAFGVLFTKVPCGVICFFITSEGLRLTVSPLGQKLYRLPGLSFLADYETHALDLASCLSPLLVAGVYFSWGELLRMRLGIGSDYQRHWHAENYRRIVGVLAAVLLASDAALFYVALVEASWQGSTFSFGALLATAAYCAVMIFVTLLNIHLKEKVTRLGA